MLVQGYNSSCAFGNDYKIHLKNQGAIRGGLNTLKRPNQKIRPAARRTTTLVKFFSVVFLTAGLALGWNQLVDVSTKAGSNHQPVRSFSVSEQGGAQVHISEAVSPWLKLKPGKNIATKYLGTEAAIQSLEVGSLRPLTMAAADFNADGYADLISGFADHEGGGVLAFHKANREAFEPKDEEVLAGLRRGEFPVSFEKQALCDKGAKRAGFYIRRQVF